MSQNPNERVKMHADKAIEHMDFIFDLLKERCQQAEEGKCDWGDVGDIAHVSDNLSEIVAAFSGEE